VQEKAAQTLPLECQLLMKESMVYRRVQEKAVQLLQGAA
jgi:hypothetical protein